jgi:hypothetical protein
MNTQRSELGAATGSFVHFSLIGAVVAYKFGSGERIETDGSCILILGVPLLFHALLYLVYIMCANIYNPTQC